MNPLFWLLLAVTAAVAYHVGAFITLRDLRIAAEELMDQMHKDNQKQRNQAEEIATQAIADNQTGTPIGLSLAREMGIKL